MATLITAIHMVGSAREPWAETSDRRVVRTPTGTRAGLSRILGSALLPGRPARFASQGYYHRQGDTGAGEVTSACREAALRMRGGIDRPDRLEEGKNDRTVAVDRADLPPRR